MKCTRRKTASGSFDMLDNVILYNLPISIFRIHLMAIFAASDPPDGIMNTSGSTAGRIRCKRIT
jgi:hypothetical protein